MLKEYWDCIYMHVSILVENAGCWALLSLCTHWSDGNPVYSPCIPISSSIIVLWRVSGLLSTHTHTHRHTHTAYTHSIHRYIHTPYIYKLRHTNILHTYTNTHTHKSLSMTLQRPLMSNKAEIGCSNLQSTKIT